ncbi:uncharacterized protein LOC105633562 isoform X2 [Jatropha curcas]|uniref:uncharacterized protein LOC105633562 isoform X2 n=1 Tax=Jatropha curcas TaxID=180498 RepID=UPI0005FADF77|nr:uncharacterized protein LOC105633562 isoform X2 [Jatropha curcas]
MRNAMVAIENRTLFFFNNLSSSSSSSSSSSNLYPPKKNGQKYFATLAKKRDDLSEDSKTQKKQPFFPLRVSNSILSQSAVAVFGLGFIDAGGDWSRIGVISKESEDLLKIAAFVVIPLCIFLVFSISRKEQA